MTERQEHKIRESFYNSPIFQYYDEKGHARAAAIANQIAFGQTKEGKRLASLGGIKTKLNGTRLKKTETSFSKEKILEAHSKCKTWNAVLEYLGIWHGTYTRLCKKYGIKELKADRSITTKLSKQHNVQVWKLVEEEIGLFDSTKKVSDYFQIHQTSVGRLARNRGKKDKGKTNFAESSDGSLLTFEFTGKKISDGSKRDPSRQIRVYKLYEIFHKEYDSITDANDDLNISFFKQLQGECYQTGGYRIYKK
jgi:hypothetical protein